MLPDAPSERDSHGLLWFPEDVEQTIDRTGPLEVDLDLRWGLAAALSLGVLWVFAPSGLWLLLFIGIIVVCHEAGHLLAARRAGMRPTEFFWGFGPEIIAFERNGCRYGVKAVFLGGYVKLHGMSPTSELPEGFLERDTYRNASHIGRLATILAGPAVNLAMAVMAFTIAARLSGGSLGGSVVTGFDHLWFVISSTGDALWTWASSIGTYAGSLMDTSGATEAPVRFMSPVSQAEVTGSAVADGWITSLRWFGILSCAIGAVNLLPLPPLDGAHALVAASEWIGQRFRRDRTIRVDVRRLEPLAYLTVFVLVGLSLSALVLDLRDVGIG
jgi:membrane-associated protease RseP (regulator of RpoE activity)